MAIPPSIVTSRTRGQYERPPIGEFVLNEASDQALGLVSLWTLDGRLGLRDLCRGRRDLAVTGTFTRKPVPDGSFAFSNTGSTSNYLDVGSTPVTAAPLTFSLWVNLASTAAIQDAFYIQSTDLAHYWGMYLNTTNGSTVTAGRVAFSCAAGGTEVNASPTNTLTVGTPGLITNVAASATSRVCYLNTTSASNTTSRSPTVARVTIGAATDGVGGIFGPLNASIYLAGIWNIARSAGSVNRAYDGKYRWELLYALNRKTYSFNSQASGATPFVKIAGTPASLAGNSGGLAG